MTDIRLTGVPEELAAKIEAAWERFVEELPREDLEHFWAESAERAEALLAALDELLELGPTRLLARLLIEARYSARTEAREARRHLDEVRRKAEAVSP